MPDKSSFPRDIGKELDARGIEIRPVIPENPDVTEARLAYETLHLPFLEGIELEVCRFPSARRKYSITTRSSDTL